jgi:hypothetical protein
LRQTGAPSQLRFFGATFSGPIQKKKSSFFLDISNRDQDSNAVVNAIILDPSFNPVQFNEEICGSHTKILDQPAGSTIN